LFFKIGLLLFSASHLRPEDLPDLLLLLLLLVDEVLVALLFLLDELELDLTVELWLLLPVELECERVVVAFLLPEELSDLTVVLLLLLVERSGVTVLLRVLGELFLVELSDDLTVELRFVDVPLREVVPSVTLVLLLLLLTVPLPVVVFLSVLLPLTEDLVFVVLPLFASGRYTLTELPLTLVALPERLLLLSSRRTVAFLPVSRS